MQAVAYTMHFELGIEPVSKRALLDCMKYCLSILTKIKLLITNVETAQLVFSVVVFLPKGERKAITQFLKSRSYEST